LPLSLEVQNQQT